MSQQVPVITSHSRLGCFETCPQLYYREYILKDRAKRTQADHFIIGDRCHKSIEDYATDAKWNHPQDAMVFRVEEYLKAHNSLDLLGELERHSESMKYLLWRASEECQTSERIRNKDKSVPKNPYMNKAFQGEMEKLGLTEAYAQIDKTFRDRQDDSYATVSISNVYSECWDIIPKWTMPEPLEMFEAIEFPISERIFKDGVYQGMVHPVQLADGTYYNGFIDVVGRLKPEYGGGICLADWKTSQGDPPSVLSVACNQQLLKYVKYYAEVTKKATGTAVWATHIAIGHLRTNTFVMAEVDPDHVEFTIKRQQEIMDEIAETKTFHRRDPFGYNSPCLKMSKGVVTGKCAHFVKCWPEIEAKLPKPEEEQPTKPLQEGFGF